MQLVVERPDPVASRNRLGDVRKSPTLPVETEPLRQQARELVTRHPAGGAA